MKECNLIWVKEKYKNGVLEVIFDSSFQNHEEAIEFTP